MRCYRVILGTVRLFQSFEQSGLCECMCRWVVRWDLGKQVVVVVFFVCVCGTWGGGGVV